MTAITELKISKSQIKKLAENIRILLDSNHVSENEVAQALGIPVVTIRRLASGETTDPRISTLKLIADYFKVTMDSLLEDNHLNVTALMSKNMPQFIPIIDWVTASQVNSIKELNLISWGKWQPISLSAQKTISDLAFALESKPFMQPRFPIGSIFIIDPTIPPSDGDIALIKIKNTSELTLRELLIDPPEWQLHPLVPGTSILSHSFNKYDIAGVVILTLLFNRKIID